MSIIIIWQLTSGEHIETIFLICVVCISTIKVSVNYLNDVLYPCSKLSFRNFNVGLLSNLKNHKRILYKLSIQALKRASCFNLKPTKCICKAARYKLVNRYIAYNVHLSFDLLCMRMNGSFVWEYTNVCVKWIIIV